MMLQQAFGDRYRPYEDGPHAPINDKWCGGSALKLLGNFDSAAGATTIHLLFDHGARERGLSLSHVSDIIWGRARPGLTGFL